MRCSVWGLVPSCTGQGEQVGVLPHVYKEAPEVPPCPPPELPSPAVGCQQQLEGEGVEGSPPPNHMDLTS